MPVMNGLEAARQLKRDGATARIIFLTMYSESQLAAEAFRLGASAYLSKFAAGEELVAAIYQAFAAEPRERLNDERPSSGPPCRINGQHSGQREAVTAKVWTGSHNFFESEDRPPVKRFVR